MKVLKNKTIKIGTKISLLATGGCGSNNHKPSCKPAFTN